MQQSYAVDESFPEEGTETETSSDSGTEHMPNPGISHMNESEAAEHIYMMYRKARRTWRRFAGKPVRKVRRFQKFKGKR